MKKKILSIGMILVLNIMLITLTGCESNTVESSKDDNTTTTNITEEVNILDNNDNYYVIINGTKFMVGDKIANLTSIGLSRDEDSLDETIGTNTYLIGGGSIYDSDNNRVMYVTPYNDTDSTITVEDAVLGGITIGSTRYSYIKDYEFALNAEVYGGIKLGSTKEELVAAFGEPTRTYAMDGTTTYYYNSEETYRNYKFYVDDNGKVSEIYWQNLVYND